MMNGSEQYGAVGDRIAASLMGAPHVVRVLPSSSTDRSANLPVCASVFGLSAYELASAQFAQTGRFALLRSGIFGQINANR
jgi:hypothetical protein